MNIEEPKNKWIVNIHFSSEQCPYRFYPANETGCRVREKMEDRSCSYENCYFKKPNETNVCKYCLKEECECSEFDVCPDIGAKG